MKSKRLLSMLVAAVMVAGSMPLTVFAGRLDYEPEETEVTEVTETEVKESSKPEVKETKPEVKVTEPEVKETEAPKETEPAKEPEAEKAPEAAAKVKAKNSTSFDDKSFKLSNGILSWTAVDGTAEYRLSMGGEEAYTKTNSFNFGKWIDELIENRKIYKDNEYDIYVFAYDADGSDISFTQITVKYSSKAEPKTKLPEVTNVKISNGVVTWDPFNGGTGLAGYNIRIVGSSTLSGWTEADKNSFDLKAYIAENAAYGFKEIAAYKIQIVALEDITWDPVAESGYVTYSYKKANTMTVKGKTVKARKKKKKSQSFKRSKILTIKKAVGKLTYVKLSGNSKITVNKTSGKLTVKKKMKKGTYKVRIAVTAAGNSTCLSVTRTVTVKVKVR